MKKYLFTMATATMLFASCSSDDALTNENGALENQEDLVEIKLGTGSRIGTSVAVSKAAVDNWDDTQIGVYALNTATPWINATGQLGIIDLMENALGIVAADADNAANAISWEDEETRYYPRGGSATDKYKFYGYYPYSEDAVINAEGTAVTVEGAFDGETDIMRGCTADGYNAASFRGENPASTPDIVFNHLTTRLKFKAVRGVNYEDHLGQCKILSMEIYAPKTYKLIIADGSTEDADAIIWPEDVQGQGNWDYHELTAQNDAVFNGGYVIPESESEVPDYIADAMVVPGMGNSAEDKYILKITLSNEENPTQTFVQDVNIIAPESLTAGFEMGKAYTITLTINGPQDIKVTATLTAWDEVENDDLEFDI